MSVPEKIYIVGPHLWGKYKCEDFQKTFTRREHSGFTGVGRQMTGKMGLMALYCSHEKERFNIEALWY